MVLLAFLPRRKPLLHNPADQIADRPVLVGRDETLPMERLVEYMHELAVLLGEPANVHFGR